MGMGMGMEWIGMECSVDNISNEHLAYKCKYSLLNEYQVPTYTIYNIQY